MEMRGVFRVIQCRLDPCWQPTGRYGIASARTCIALWQRVAGVVPLRWRSGVRCIAAYFFLWGIGYKLGEGLDCVAGRFIGQFALDRHCLGIVLLSSRLPELGHEEEDIEQCKNDADIGVDHSHRTG